MTESQITPHRITKPIQLLAAWLVGLSIINASFLTAAATIQQPDWASALLVIASVVNVPLFLVCLFLLQTKFRPQMQEDSYYSQYLDKTYSAKPPPSQSVDTEKPLRELAGKIVSQVSSLPTQEESAQEAKVVELLKDSEIEYASDRFKDSRSLSELHMYPDVWKELVASWGESRDFRQDLDELVGAGLAIVLNNSIEQTKLSPLGKAVATRLESEKKLWNMTNSRYMKPGKS